MDYLTQIQYKDDKVINVKLSKEHLEEFFTAVKEKSVFCAATENSSIWVDLDGWRLVLHGPEQQQEEKKEESET